MKPIYVASLRAFVGGLLTGVMAGLTGYAMNGNVRTAVVSGGITMVGYWIVRGGFEGVADQVRQ